IAPLYAGKSAHELLAATSDRPEQSGHDIVREYWSAHPPARSGLRPAVPGAPATAEFEDAWRRWLHDGVVPNTALSPKTVRVKSLAPPEQREAASAGRFEIAFRNDPSVLDGRFANNGWLQELPKPITKLTWDNAVLTSPATAERLKIESRP